MKKLAIIFVFLCPFAFFGAGVEVGKFTTPEDSSKPWVYWMWLNGNVDKSSITADLEAIKKMGAAGVLFFDNRGYNDQNIPMPRPRNQYLDSDWIENFSFAVSEIERLGLKISINLSSCGGNLKGPWKVGFDAPKRLVYKITPLEKSYSAALEKYPSQFYKRVAVFAVKYGGETFGSSQNWLDAGDGVYDTARNRTLVKEGGSVSRKVLEIVDLTSEVKDGALSWNVPDGGNWALLQVGYTVLDNREYDVDILDRDAVAAHFNRFVNVYKKNFPQAIGSTITHFYNVSWEGTMPTWTRGFEKFFKKDRGYDIKKWLPALCGFEFDATEAMRKFITDFRRARNNCFREHFYATMAELSHKEGVQWHSESGGPWSRKPAVFGEADQLAFLGMNDIPQGEFWCPLKHDKGKMLWTQWNRFLVRPIAWAAHIYGRNLVSIEAFTHMTYHWTAYPAMLKPAADFSFVMGSNFTICHTYTSSPDSFGEPGIEYFSGTHFNRHTTWHAQSVEFMTYLARCQYLLRQGRPVVDFAVYNGDVPYEGWLSFGGKISPFMRGLCYDVINNDVLLNGAKFENGRLILKSGISYKALYVALNRREVSPKALAKILELKRAGLLVFCSPEGSSGSTPDFAVKSKQPVFAPSVKPDDCAGLGEDGTSVKQLADALWDGRDFGEYCAKNFVPACESEKFEFIARSADDAEIFFLTGEGSGNATFVADGVPEIWNAVDGSIAKAQTWRKTADGRISVSLELPKNGSVFVVFRKNSDAPNPDAFKPTKQLEISGKWTVSFRENRGAPASIALEKLVPLNEYPDFGVRHFSGTARYCNTFTLDNVPQRARLDLPEVNYIAEVYINGQKCATLWTYPYSCDISKFLKKGENKIEIDITNTWYNRCVGDAAAPDGKRITSGNFKIVHGARNGMSIFTGFAADDPLMRAGLVGKVVVSF